MHGNAETGLAFLLFLPTFCIVGTLYCLFPKVPRDMPRILGDLAVLVLATALSIFAMIGAFHSGVGIGGAVWKQVVATLAAYIVFLAVMAIAWPIRAMLFRRLRR
jgi:hypothetical protein